MIYDTGYRSPFIRISDAALPSLEEVEEYRIDVMVMEMEQKSQSSSGR